MRKFKLQMQISVNAIVTVEPGATNFNWDNEVRSFSIENLNAVDAIILGRKTAEDFIPYWEKVSKDPTHNDYEFGKRLTDIPKVVFSAELKTSKWTNATIVNGNISEEIQKLKSKEGRDMIVYGGISFVSSLIEHKLIDEAHLLVNPAAFCKGKTIFKSLKSNLKLAFKRCKPFASGTVLLSYSMVE